MVWHVWGFGRVILPTEKGELAFSENAIKFEEFDEEGLIKTREEIEIGSDGETIFVKTRELNFMITDRRIVEAVKEMLNSLIRSIENEKYEELPQIMERAIRSIENIPATPATKEEIFDKVVDKFYELAYVLAKKQKIV